MNQTDYNFLMKLRTGKVPCSSVPKSVRGQSYFENLIKDKIIIVEGNWYRGSVLINEKEREYFEDFFNNHFGDVSEHEINKATNIKVFHDSKARKTESPGIYFIRGNQKIILNDKPIELKEVTKDFGQLAPIKQVLECDKLCFIENLYFYLNAEKIIPQEFVFLHPYGRLGDTILNCLNAKEVLVASDYDFVGLDEFLKIKQKFHNASFFIPDNFDELFDQYAKPLKNKKGTHQTPSKRVLESKNETVIKIRNKIFETQKFLEQEILILEHE